MGQVTRSFPQEERSQHALSPGVLREDKYVVIIGGGSIGRFLALEMALGGVQVSIIESNSAVIERD